MPAEELSTSIGTSTTNATDWRKPTTPEDMLSALDSLYSPDDFTGRAAFYESATATSPLDIDLLVQSIQFNLEEHLQLSHYVGDIFGAICFGKKPLHMTVSCVLVDGPENYGKQYLVDCYKNRLRLSAVARTGNVPVLRCLDSVYTGPVTGMQLSESGAQEDVLIVTFTMLVLSLNVSHNGSLVTFDYLHGTDGVSDSVSNSATDGGETSKADDEVRLLMV